MELYKTTYLFFICFRLQHYFDDTLIHSLQLPNWYGKFVSSNPGMTMDYTNKYIGVARFRQQRSHNFSCSIPMKMFFLNMTCISDFSTGPLFKNFSEKWNDVSQSDSTDYMDNSWKYTQHIIAGTLKIIGNIQVLSTILKDISFPVIISAIHPFRCFGDISWWGIHSTTWKDSKEFYHSFAIFEDN